MILVINIWWFLWLSFRIIHNIIWTILSTHWMISDVPTDHLWVWSRTESRLAETSLHLFLTRFAEPPATIIYDNCCKLHQYCLNHQPAHFKNMLFFVDRFHWCGHVGCSSGYSLDRYPSPFISTINSQVNEQANPGLQRICLYEARQLHVSSKAFPSNHQNRIKYMLAG